MRGLDAYDWRIRARPRAAGVMLPIYALLPEYPPEHKARLRLARQLAAHRATAPD